VPELEAPAEYDPPRRLRQLPSWQSSVVARRAQRLVSDALGQEGARRQHFTVLTSLAEQGPASQAALGRRLWIDRSDLHAILNELERDGHVERARDELDRRRNVVALTRRGASFLKRLDKGVDAAQTALLEPLSAADRRELRRLLQQLVDRGVFCTGSRPVGHVSGAKPEEPRSIASPSEVRE
jgi:MarR family transcriptional regulator, lower aerobic nicotinate degradation pathway regulator